MNQSKMQPLNDKIYQALLKQDELDRQLLHTKEYYSDSKRFHLR